MEADWPDAYRINRYVRGQEPERASHYFHAHLAQQFDYVFHLDQTRAVEPLERGPLWEAGELPDTFPSGL